MVYMSDRSRAGLSSLTVPERRFKVLTAVKNAFYQHGVSGDHECNGNPPLESDRTQAGQQIVSLAPPHWECGETCTEGYDSGDVSIGPNLARLVRDICMQGFDMALSSVGEYNAHRRGPG
jgi:hypothetical protein